MNEQRYTAFCRKRDAIAGESARLKKLFIHPQTTAANQFEQRYGQKIEREYNGIDLMRRPEVGYHDLMMIDNFGPGVDDNSVALQVEIQATYQGYIARQQSDVARLKKYETTLIPESIDYHQVAGLSNEVRQKLTPAAISILLMHVKRRMVEL